MNFITWQGPSTGLELKYCERCGGLWVRLQGETEAYCAKCRRQIAELPQPTRTPDSATRPRLPRPDREEVEKQYKYKLESLEGIAEVEVRL